MEESAKLSKNKRIRHAYPRRELYHRFVHSEEYAYSPYTGYQVSCKGNYLITGNVGKNTTVEDIEEMWNYFKSKMIAIIDRDNKRILINRTFTDHYWDLRRAVPDDYTIFTTRELIPNKDILSDNKECLRIHSKHMIQEFTDRLLSQYYSILTGNSKAIYHSITDDFSNTDKSSYNVKEIIKFINDNKLKKYDFYKECFDEHYKLKFYKRNYRSNTLEIKLPTLQQIINNTIFTKKEKLFLDQRYFWTKYCKGNGIYFNEVVDNWNKEVDRKTIIERINKIIYLTESSLDNCHTWNDYIVTAVNADRAAYDNYIKENREISTKNYLEALDKLKKQSNYSVNDWREHKTVSLNRVPYRCFIHRNNKRDRGEWVDRYVNDSYSDNRFDNTQLRLNLSNTYIETSRYASVPLEEGIKMYKMFNIARNNNPNNTSWTSADFGDVKVGLYNLRFITYKDKVTDNNIPLGYKEWLIQIGCHRLWLDDVENFIRYYHLEDKFGLHKTE